jgi:hypothetical protein
MRERTMVVAGGLEDDADRMLEAMEIIGEEAEPGRGVGQDQALAVLPARSFDQNVMTQLGDIDGYQNGGRLSGLNQPCPSESDIRAAKTPALGFFRGAS